MLPLAIPPPPFRPHGFELEPEHLAAGGDLGAQMFAHAPELALGQPVETARRIGGLASQSLVEQGAQQACVSIALLPAADEVQAAAVFHVSIVAPPENGGYHSPMLWRVEICPACGCAVA